MHSEDPLVSIVMPSYNHGHFLKRTIKSIIDQSYTNWELLLVDNHSSDNTDEVIATFNDNRIKVYKIHNEGVVAKSRNQGLKMSKGELIAFLDSDDWWRSDKLWLSVQAIKAGADFIYHDMFNVVDERNYEAKVFSFPKVRKPVFNSLLTEGNVIINSSVVVRSEFTKSVGQLDDRKSVIASEDYDYWIRISQLTENFNKLPQTLGYYWNGGGNLSKSRDLSIAADSILEKYRNQLNGNLLRNAEGYVIYKKALYEKSVGNKRSALSCFLKCFSMVRPLVKLKIIYNLIRMYTF